LLRTFYFCKFCKVLAIPSLQSQLGRLYTFKQAQQVAKTAGLRLKAQQLLCDTVYPPVHKTGFVVRFPSGLL